MRPGLRIRVLDEDPDFLRIEIHASNVRFSGSARVYASLTQLREFAERIAGFPVGFEDVRSYEFGDRCRNFAGGYCRLHLRCTDRAGHALVEVVLKDKEPQEPGSARFGFPVVAADIDQFT